MCQVLGAVDIIGNPVSLFKNIASGVEDFFYEPYQGMVRSPEEFGRGLARGTASLLRNSISGVLEGVSKITQTVSKGLAEASFDDAYKDQRLEEQRQRPTNALRGLSSGGMTLLRGFGSGFAGLFTKPVEGARREGAVGFIKGVGTGVAGVVTKPVIGVLDGAAKVAQGLSSSAAGVDPRFIASRRRLPRFIPFDGLLCSYSTRDSQGADILRNACRGRYLGEHFVAQLELTPANSPTLRASRSGALHRHVLLSHQCEKRRKQKKENKIKTSSWFSIIRKLLLFQPGTDEMTWDLDLEAVHAVSVEPNLLTVSTEPPVCKDYLIDCTDNHLKNRFADALQAMLLDRQRAGYTFR